jgi:hypothetical protein
LSWRQPARVTQQHLPAWPVNTAESRTQNHRPARSGTHLRW